MPVYPSPAAARAANVAPAASNASEAVKGVTQHAVAHVQPTTDAGYVKKIFEVTGATNTGP